MLKVMRDSFKHLKWILLLIVAAFVIMVFAQWGAGGTSGAVSNVSFVARVNGDVIGVREYSRSMYYTEKQYEQAYGTALTPEMRDQLGLTQLVLNSLIDQKLLLQEAERLNLDATPQEVRDYILKMPILNPEGTFVGEELYQRYVTGNLGYPSTAAFEDDIEQEITLSKINSALLSAVVIPPARAEQEFRRRNENASIRYVLLPTDRTLPTTQVAPAEVEQHYRENTSRYTHPEQRNVNYLLADMARVRAQITIPEAELRARYEGTKATYRQPEQVKAQHILVSVEATAAPEQDAAARAKAEEALQKAKSGSDFAELVRQYSDEPGAAERAGDLGFFGRGQMVPEFEKAVFAMQPGQISDLVRTNFGYHIIKVNERRAESVRTFEEVRPEIEARLAEDRAKTQAREAIASARTRLEQLKPVTPEKMESVTGQLVTYNAGGWFGKTEAVPGLGRAPSINDWSFGAVAVGETSNVLETQRGPANRLPGRRAPGRRLPARRDPRAGRKRCEARQSPRSGEKAARRDVRFAPIGRRSRFHARSRPAGRLREQDDDGQRPDGVVGRSRRRRDVREAGRDGRADRGRRGRGAPDRRRAGAVRSFGVRGAEGRAHRVAAPDRVPEPPRLPHRQAARERGDRDQPGAAAEPERLGRRNVGATACRSRSCPDGSNRPSAC